jgi:hypothetical protein
MAEKDWTKIRVQLRAIKEQYHLNDDMNLSNMSVICDLLILCTYNPDELEPLYFTLNKHIDDILGGTN